MKNCDEWVKHILEVRDKQLALRRKRRKAAIRYSSLAACFCVTVLLGSQVLKSIETIRKNDLIKSPSSSSVSDTRVTTSDMTDKTTIKINTSVTEISVDHTKPAVTTYPRDKVTEKPKESGGYEKNTHINTAPAVTAKPVSETSEIKKQTTAPTAVTSTNNIMTKKTTRPPVQTSPTAATKKTTVKFDNETITEATKTEPVIATETIEITMPEVIFITSKITTTETNTLPLTTAAYNTDTIIIMYTSMPVK